VTDPATNTTTTVSSLVVDPNGTPTAGQTAFVVLADGNVVLVKSATAGANALYNDYDQTFTGTGGNDPNYIPTDTLTITAINGNAVTVLNSAGNSSSTLVTAEMTETTYQGLFAGGATEANPVMPPNTTSASSAGVRDIQYGAGGDGGRDGALFVPPTSGDDGSPGPPINTSSSQSVNTGSVGVEIASIGGTGGNGGNSYASFWDGRSGGSGGAGGSVIYEETVPSATQTNDPCIAANSCTVVQTSGANNYGIF